MRHREEIGTHFAISIAVFFGARSVRQSILEVSRDSNDHLLLKRALYLELGVLGFFTGVSSLLSGCVDVKSASELSPDKSLTVVELATQGSYNVHSYLGDFGRLMVGM